MIKFWSGSEDSFHAYLQALPMAEARRQAYEANVKAGYDEDDEDDDEDLFPSIYQVVGDVGVIKISGSLIPGQARWMRYYGVLGYDDIKNALVKAVADQNVKSILIHTNSGGGAVNGVESARDFIKNVSAVKPTNVFSELCCSAAYWLASAAGHITSSSTAINGSIGVIRVAIEYSKKMEQDGVTAKVLRAGKYKALVNPYEPLTDEAEKAELERLNDIYEIFTASVASARGVSQAVADQMMGQGKEFLGKRGLEVGLIDAVGTFDDALAYSKSNRSRIPENRSNFAVRATGTVANRGAVADNAAISNQPEEDMHLTPEQLAALAGGAPRDEVLAMGSDAPGDASETTTAQLAEADTTEADTAKVALEAVKAELETAKTQLAEANTKLDAANADVTALTTVVQASVKNLHVILGKTDDVSAMSASQLATAYAEASTAVQEKFKAGGVTRRTTTVEKPEAQQPKAALIGPRDAAAMQKIFNTKR